STVGFRGGVPHRSADRTPRADRTDHRSGDAGVREIRRAERSLKTTVSAAAVLAPARHGTRPSARRPCSGTWAGACPNPRPPGREVPHDLAVAQRQLAAQPLGALHPRAGLIEKAEVPFSTRSTATSATAPTERCP